MTGGKGIGVQAMAMLLVLAVSAPAFALGQFCIVKGGNTAAPTGTPCADGVASYNSGGKTLVHFSDGCTAPKVFDMVFEQEPGNAQAVGGMQASMAYDPSEMTDPTCTLDPQNFFMDTAGLECPGFHGTSNTTYVFGGEANVSGDNYPLNTPNFIAMSVSFATFSIPEGATGTASHFTAAPSKRSTILNFDAEPIASLVNADVTCRSMMPDIRVEAPKNVVFAIQGQGSCTSESCPATVTISYDLPTQCRIEGIDGWTRCDMSSVCLGPGVIVNQSSPEQRVIATLTRDTTVTTEVDFAGGAFYNISLTSACYNGHLGGMSYGQTLSVSTNEFGDYFSPEIGKYDVAGDSEITVGHAACGTFLSGQGIDVSDRLPGMTADHPVTLYYGHESGTNAFPQQITANTSSGGVINLTIPGHAVESGKDLFWSLYTQHETMGFDEYYPLDYDQTVQTAARISGACIEDKPETFQARQPYPDQMPFQAGHGRPLIIDFALTEQADIYFSIYTMQGREVRRIISSNADPHSVANTCHWEKGCSWDGTNAGGGLVGNGLYIINLHVTGTGQYYGGQTFDYTKGLVVMK